jgi:hypothetical protein
MKKSVLGNGNFYNIRKGLFVNTIVKPRFERKEGTSFTKIRMGGSDRINDHAWKHKTGSKHGLQVFKQKYNNIKSPPIGV